MKHFYTTFLALFIAGQLLADAPTVPATNLSFNIIEGNYFNMSWTAGNGARRIIIARAGQAVTAVPEDGVDYQENTEFGTGQEIATGQYVVYDHFSSSFYLTGLSPNTEYYFAVYEYNGTGAAIQYLNDPLTGHSSTSKTPTVQASQIQFSNITATTVTISLTKGDGGRRLIVAREGAAVNADPVDLTSYSGSNAFGSGAELGNGNYSVQNSSGTALNITNLKAGTQYHFAVFEYNGNGVPVYLVPGVTANVTTRTIPTVASSNIVVSKTDGKELTISWTKGNGQRRIVVARQGSAVAGLPQNGNDYTASEQFGSGETVASNEFVVYNDVGTAATIKNLDAATTYHFRIFEFDGTGANTLYLTSASAQADASTARTPTEQATNIAASDIEGNSLKLTWEKGNGRARLLLARKGSAVNVNPQDFTAYTASANFGEGQQIGSGNYVLQSGTGELLNVHNLEPNTVYHFALFEYNGFDQPLYLQPAATFQVSTGVLPVVLSAFKGTVQSNAVQLQWTTQTEINAHHFAVQRSNDGINFTTIQSINAKGNTTAPVRYQFTDDHPGNGIIYYRLEMVDKDGSSRFSAVISLAVQQATSLKLIPGGGFITARINGTATRTQWLLHNASGQLIGSALQNSNVWQLNTAALAPGVYFIKAWVDGKEYNSRFIK